MNPRRVAFFYNNPSGLQPEEAELANILYLAWASATLLLNRRNCQTRGSAIFVFIMVMKQNQGTWLMPSPAGEAQVSPASHKGSAMPALWVWQLGITFPLNGYIFLNKKTNLPWIYIRQFPISQQMTYEN